MQTALITEIVLTNNKDNKNMFKILLILLTLNAFTKTIYHKDRHFNKAYKTARAIKDHPIQRQTLTVLEQIYKNLDTAEYQRMRSALIALSNPSKYDSRHETVYLFKEAIEKIPGAKITTDFTILSEAEVKRRRWERASEPPIYLSSKKEIQDFHVSSRSISFELDNKIYSITPELLGRTTFTLDSADAIKHNEAFDMLFGKTGNDEKEREKRSNAWQETIKTEYCVDHEKRKKRRNAKKETIKTEHCANRNKRKIDNKAVAYILKTDYDYYTTNTGNPSLSADKLSLSVFAAAANHHKSILPLAWYINGDKHETQYTEEQKVRIKEIEEVPNFLSRQTPPSIISPQYSQGAN